jgi:hypothetical protein
MTMRATTTRMTAVLGANVTKLLTWVRIPARVEGCGFEENKRQNIFNTTILNFEN